MPRLGREEFRSQGGTEEAALDYGPVEAQEIVELGAFGSPEVTLALDGFRDTTRSFFVRAAMVRTIETQGASGQQSVDALEARDRARRRRVTPTTGSQPRSTTT